MQCIAPLFFMDFRTNPRLSYYNMIFKFCPELVKYV